MIGYSHMEHVELARELLIDCKGVMGPIVRQLRAMFPDLTLHEALSMIEEARVYRLNA